MCLLRCCCLLLQILLLLLCLFVGLVCDGQPDCCKGDLQQDFITACTGHTSRGGGSGRQHACAQAVAAETSVQGGSMGVHKPCQQGLGV